MLPFLQSVLMTSWSQVLLWPLHGHSPVSHNMHPRPTPHLRAASSSMNFQLSGTSQASTLCCAEHTRLIWNPAVQAMIC